MKRIISLVCCALLSVFAMGGCADNGEPFSSKTYTADGAQIKSISIDVRDRQIEVSPSENHQIHIDYFENDKEYYDISVSDESVLTITAADSKEWSDYIGGKAAAEYRKISVRIPDALLQSLTVSTTNEEIVLSELAVTDSVSPFASNGGNIRFAKLTVGREIALTAKNRGHFRHGGGELRRFCHPQRCQEGREQSAGNERRRGKESERLVQQRRHIHCLSSFVADGIPIPYPLCSISGRNGERPAGLCVDAAVRQRRIPEKGFARAPKPRSAQLLVVHCAG